MVRNITDCWNDQRSNIMSGWGTTTSWYSSKRKKTATRALRPVSCAPKSRDDQPPFTTGIARGSPRSSRKTSASSIRMQACRRSESTTSAIRRVAKLLTFHR